MSTSELRLKESEIVVGSEISKEGGRLYLCVEDRYNSRAQATSIDRQEAMDLIAHLQEVFNFTLDEMHFGYTRDEETTGE